MKKGQGLSDELKGGSHGYMPWLLYVIWSGALNEGSRAQLLNFKTRILLRYGIFKVVLLLNVNCCMEQSEVSYC